VVENLARKYEKVLFLQVEADAGEQEEIAESFNVDSVPTVVVLRGHTLLERISGTDGTALINTLEKHNPTLVSSHIQTISPIPAKGTDEQLVARIHGLLRQSKVVLFMKGSPDAPRCGFSRKTVNILREKGVEFTHFDILEDEAVRQRLKEINNWPTYPQIIVNGELVGGLDILEEMLGNGEFDQVFLDTAMRVHA